MLPDNGRVKKPVGSPPKINIDRRALDSTREPSTKASTIGPGSKPAFFIKYPMRPKPIIRKMSNTELLIV